MSNKISTDAAQALFNFKPFTRNNTHVSVSKIDENHKKSQLYLHGNIIAEVINKIPLQLRIGNAGWPTQTTRARLSSVLYEYYQISGKFYQVSIKKRIMYVIDDKENKHEITTNLTDPNQYKTKIKIKKGHKLYEEALHATNKLTIIPEVSDETLIIIQRLLVNYKKLLDNPQEVTK